MRPENPPDPKKYFSRTARAVPCPGDAFLGPSIFPVARTISWRAVRERDLPHRGSTDVPEPARSPAFTALTIASYAHGADHGTLPARSVATCMDRPGTAKARASGEGFPQLSSARFCIPYGRCDENRKGDSAARSTFANSVFFARSRMSSAAIRASAGAV